MNLLPGSDDAVAKFAFNLPMGVNAYISCYFLCSDASCQVLRGIGNLCMCEILYHKKSSCKIVAYMEGPVMRDFDMPNRSIGPNLQ